MLVVRNSLGLVAIGILLGAPLVYAAGRALGSLLYGVGAHEAGPLVLSAATLVAVALAATTLPAWRASRTDPLSALRAE
jgi:ABC-type antimicrobial peptide transport system permease subunit